MLGLVCPHCGAPLPSEAATRQHVVCRYCTVTVVLGDEQVTAPDTSAARRPLDDMRPQLAAFREAVRAGIDDGGDAVTVMRSALDRFLGLGSEGEVVTRVVLAICREFRVESGVDVSGDTMVLCRIAEAYLSGLDDLATERVTTLDLPFLTATSQGPVHLQRPLTLSQVREYASSEPAPPAKKRGWWPFS